MDDMSRKFVGCILPTEEIRDAIRKILKIEDAYFCYKCFKLLGINAPSKEAKMCGKCYQFYCEPCAKLFYFNNEFSSNKCIQCLDLR